jgi:transcriptional regulator with XRE-family HTH domain
MDQVQEIGRRIAAAREHLGWTQEALALHAGLGAPEVVSSYERGGRQPGSENLTRIAGALNVTTDYLLGLERANIAAHVRLRDQVSARLSAAVNDRIEWEHRNGITVARHDGRLVEALFWDRSRAVWRALAADPVLTELQAVEAVLVGLLRVIASRLSPPPTPPPGEQIQFVMDRDADLLARIGEVTACGEAWQATWVIQEVEHEVLFEQGGDSQISKKPGKARVSLVRRGPATVPVEMVEISEEELERSLRESAGDLA